MDVKAPLADRALDSSNSSPWVASARQARSGAMFPARWPDEIANRVCELGESKANVKATAEISAGNPADSLPCSRIDPILCDALLLPRKEMSGKPDVSF